MIYWNANADFRLIYSMNCKSPASRHDAAINRATMLLLVIYTIRGYEDLADRHAKLNARHRHVQFMSRFRPASNAGEKV